MTYSCTDFTDTIIEKLKIDIPEGFRDSPEAQAEICCTEIGLLQDFALAVRRSIINTVRDDRNYNAFRNQIERSLNTLDALNGDTMIEGTAMSFDELTEVAQ